MLDKRMFAEMRKAGMHAGLSRSKLSQAMLDVLIQLPQGTTNLKEIVVDHLGLLGQMSATRDINEAWKQTKKMAAKEYPEKFILDDRTVLHWNEPTVKVMDKKISSANFRKLNELADSEHCNVNALVSKLIRCYRKRRP